MYLKDRTFISSLSLSLSLGWSFFHPSPLKWPLQGGGRGWWWRCTCLFSSSSFFLCCFSLLFLFFPFVRSALFGLYNREGKNVCANIFRRSWLAFIRCSPATLDMNFRAASLCTCIPTIGRPYSPQSSRPVVLTFAPWAKACSSSTFFSRTIPSYISLCNSNYKIERSILAMHKYECIHTIQ